MAYTEHDALWWIIQAARNQRMSVTELKRIQRAGRLLGLDSGTQLLLEYYLEYRNRNLELRKRWENVK